MSQSLARTPPTTVRWALLALLAAALVVAGCSSPDKKKEEAATASETQSVKAGSEEFPNLGTVPDQAPESTPKIEREKLLQQLASDRANAEYTDETLDEATTQVPAAEPPPPGAAAPEVPADGEA